MMETTNYLKMYDSVSELGKMQLNQVKADLYEVATKVILYSIEVYSGKSLSDFAKTELVNKLSFCPGSLEAAESELKTGRVSKIDTTNGCMIINNFLRKEALAGANASVAEVIQRKEAELQRLREQLSTMDHQEGTQELTEEEEENQLVLQLLGENVEEALFRDGEGAAGIDKFRWLNEQIEILEGEVCKLKNLQKSGKGHLGKQDRDERDALDKLRICRNASQHNMPDEFYITDPGSWHPEAGELYVWGQAINEYINVFLNRYGLYSLFDERYAAEQGKEHFENCRMQVSRLLKKLYINNTNTVFEFAGEYYDKDAAGHDFGKLLEDMAQKWEVGWKYMTFANYNEMPEMDRFFRECLSGTDKYITVYLYGKERIRDHWRNRNVANLEVCYAKFLFLMTGSFYWRGRECPERVFAERFLHKLLSARDEETLYMRLKFYERYTGGMNLIYMAEEKLLSLYYTNLAKKDVSKRKGVELAKRFEVAMGDFVKLYQQAEYVRMAQTKTDEASGQYVVLQRKQNRTRQRMADAHKSIVAIIRELCAFMENLGVVPYRFTYKGKGVVFRSLQEVQAFIKGIRTFEELVEVKTVLLKDYNFEAWIKGVKGDGGV